MLSTAKPKVTVLLANLGTPDEPTAAAVRRFLKQFLSDQRVIEIPKPIWQIILNLFILPFRPKRVAHAYAMVWQQDSPMREILLQQVDALKQQLLPLYPEFELNIRAGNDLWQSGYSTGFGSFESKSSRSRDFVPFISTIFGNLDCTFI